MKNEEKLINLRKEDWSWKFRNKGEKIYFAKNLEERGDILNPDSFNVIKLPSKSSWDDFSLTNLENALNRKSGLSCGILNQTMENILSLGNNDELVKCVSLVTSILCSERENSANSPLESDFGLNVTSYSLDFKNSNSSFFTFSSSRNLSSFLWDDGDIIFTSGNYSSVMQSCFDMFFSEGGKERIHDFFNRHSSFEHFQNLPNHDSCAFESRNSPTDFSVNDNIFVNLDSHDNDNAEEYLNLSLGKMRKEVIR